MLSALITSKHGYPAMLLVEQLVRQRFRNSGPLVLGIRPLKTYTLVVEMDRAVSRRSEPS